MHYVDCIIFVDKRTTNPYREFHCIAINGDLFGLVIHSDCALHVLVELIFGESQENAENNMRITS